MICPFCQRPVTAFAKVPDGRGGDVLRCPLPDCPGEGVDVPLLYPIGYDEHPALPVSIFGPTGHGKTVFIDSLLTHIENHVRWPGFFSQWMDENGMAVVRARLTDMRTTGRLPDGTARVFPTPMVLRLSNIPRVGGCQLLLYDTSGETFTNSDDLIDSGRYIRFSPAVVWLVSLTDLEHKQQLSDLMTVYAQAMARMGGSPKSQSLVLTLTKGDLLLDHPDFPNFPADAAELLTDDDLNPAGNAWDRLVKVSAALEAWLANGPHRNVVNLLKGQFKSVRFCVVSAQGAAAEGNVIDTPELMPRGVLAPLFWLWRELRPPVWVETAGKSHVFFDLPAALKAAPPKSVVKLDAGEYTVGAPLKFSQSVAVVGAGMKETVVRSSARECGFAVKSAEKVIFRGLTLAHSGPEPADVVRVLGGEVAFDKCRVTGAIDLFPNIPGDGLVASATADVTLNACEADGNRNNGVSTRGTARAVLVNCTLTNNSWAGAEFAGGVAEVRGGTASDNGQFGIHVTAEAKATVEKIGLARNKKFGLVASKKCELTASGLLCEENGRDGVRIKETARVQLSNSKCVRNAAAGVAVEGNTAPALDGILSAKNTGAGLSVEGTCAPTVAGGQFHDNGGPGVLFAGPSAGVLDGVTVDRNRDHGIKLTDTASPTLRNCTVTGNKPQETSFGPHTARQVPNREPPIDLVPAAGNKATTESGVKKKGWFG